MVQIITGNRGIGKTKELLGIANDAVKTAAGTLVYLDKSTKHMFELDNKVRLINVRDYPVRTVEAFMGFLCGIISQDHDLETIYVDSFLTMTEISSPEALTETISRLETLSIRCRVDFVISLAMDAEELPEKLRGLVRLAL